MNIKMTVTIPEETVDRLRMAVDHRQRSAFVANALKEKLQAMEEEQLDRALIQAYIERYKEDKALDGQWEGATLEGWS